MRVIILDPFLKNASGHCYFYDITVLNELRKRGIPVLILGNQDADSKCLQIKEFIPCLTEVTFSLFAATASVNKILSIWKKFSSCIKHIEQSLFGNGQFLLQEEGVIFVPTVYIFEQLCLAWVLFFRHRDFEKKKTRLSIVLRFSFSRNSKALTILLRIFYKLADLLLCRVKNRVNYFTDSQLLKKEYEKLLTKAVEVLPIPVFPFPLNIGKAAIERIPALNDKTVVSYVGGARFNKGFDIFVEAVERLSMDDEIKQRILFISQLDIHPQTLQDREAVSKAAQKLKSLSGEVDNVKIIYGVLSEADYYGLLQQSHIIVLPYRDEAYKTATANILVEAILLGRVPLVSSNTWMAYELSKCGLGDLVFKVGDVEGLAGKIKEAAFGYSGYQSKINDVRKDWESLHSVKNLVDSLVNP